jgi:hypothetical protein
VQSTNVVAHVECTCGPDTGEDSLFGGLRCHDVGRLSISLLAYISIEVLACRFVSIMMYRRAGRQKFGHKKTSSLKTQGARIKIPAVPP